MRHAGIDWPSATNMVRRRQYTESRSREPWDALGRLRRYLDRHHDHSSTQPRTLRRTGDSGNADSNRHGNECARSIEHDRCCPATEQSSPRWLPRVDGGWGSEIRHRFHRFRKQLGADGRRGRNRSNIRWLFARWFHKPLRRLGRVGYSSQ